MSQKLFLFSAAILLIAGFGLIHRNAASAQTPNGEEIVIVVGPELGQPSGAPRSPVFNPFTAYLLGNTILLNSSSSCGDVDVLLTSTAGDHYTTVFDTSDGSILIPVSGYTGDYTLLLTTASGVLLFGEFEI